MGTLTLQPLTSKILEVFRVTAKATDPAPVDTWDFVTTNGTAVLPDISDFQVTVDGQAVSVTRTGFKRRVVFAPLKKRDLRLGNWLYLELASPVSEGQTVRVGARKATLWDTNLVLSTVADPQRYSAAIHVNQEGYTTGLPKTAMVGEYLGSLGEMPLPGTNRFELVDALTGLQVYAGDLTNRPDQGFSYLAVPYQQVWQADFSSFTNSGRYRIRVPGLGVSSVFRIQGDVSGVFARAYSLGLYHQRCGTSNALPLTRFEHGVCHSAPVAVPTMEFTEVNRMLASWSAEYLANWYDPRHTAPLLTNVNACLYPFVNTGTLDVAGGHHDAGDYSRYTASCANLAHILMFAVDAIPGIADLDNLGLPESGDGRSDVLQEAKWELDCIAKLQDADGGFYFLVYPRNRCYEEDVLPDHGDPQVVYPKNTAATAAAVAALAQAASSARMKALYPEAAAVYLEKALRGWTFLTNAFARFGRDGAYQRLTHGGDSFLHDDEVAWAAAELYAATGDSTFEKELMDHFDPSSSSTWIWGWWRMARCYGNAIRSYAFAARTGRLPASRLNTNYLAKCEAEIIACAEDNARWSRQCAYGSSFPEPTKWTVTAGWYFSADQAFDIVVGCMLTNKSDWKRAVVENVNFEAGCNPINRSFVTGIGLKQQVDIVNQYAQNDRRILPPSGIPIGNLQSGFQWLDNYKRELGTMTFPGDWFSKDPYPVYDRWGDSFNTLTEQIGLNQCRGLASTAWLMTLGTAAGQPWSPPAVTIRMTNSAPGIYLCTLEVPGMDLSGQRIIWESKGHLPSAGSALEYVVEQTGTQWVEAEVHWPDGRRVFASTNFTALRALSPFLSTVSIEPLDVSASERPSTNSIPTDTASFVFRRTGDLSGPLTVTYAISGSAHLMEDYTLVGETNVNYYNGSFTFPAGVDAHPILFQTVKDSTVELAEDAVFTITPLDTYNVGLPNEVTVTLQEKQYDNLVPVADNQIWEVNGAAPSPVQLRALDEDGDFLIYTVISPPAHGQLSGLGADLVYSPMAGFTGDEFTYQAFDGKTSSAVATVRLVKRDESAWDIVAEYRFTNGLVESAGRHEALVASGNATTGDGLLRVAEVGDHVNVVFSRDKIFQSGKTTGVEVEMHCRVDRWSGYKNYQSASWIFGLQGNWAAGMNCMQAGWFLTPEIKCALAELGQVGDLWPLGTWNTVRLTLDTNGFRACINGQIMASMPDAYLHVWANPDSYTLQVGDFQGDVDHLVVRAMSTNSAPTPPSNHAPVATGGLWTMDSEFALPVTLNATDADGDALTYTITRAPAHGAIAGEGAVRAYAPGADFDGEDSFAFKVSDGHVESAEAEVIVRRSMAQTVCLYRFNGDGNDRMGREPNLTFNGAAAVSGGRLRVSAAGDRVTVSIPRRHVYIGTNTQYLCVEARVWVEAFKGLGQAGATDLFGLDGNWSVVMKMFQVPWDPQPMAMAIPGAGIASSVLGPVFTAGQWHDLRMSMDTNGYQITVDGWSTTIASPNNLSAWANPSDLLLHCGGFDGWIDFIEVRRRTDNQAPVAQSATYELADNHALSLRLHGNDADGDVLTYTVLVPPAHGQLSGQGAGLIYTPGEGFMGDQFTYQVSDGKTVSSAATVQLIKRNIMQWDIVAEYLFTNGLAEIVGRHEALQASGAAAVSNGCLCVTSVGDRASVVIGRDKLYQSGKTTGVEVEMHCRVDRWSGYNNYQSASWIFGLLGDWAAGMNCIQAGWYLTPEIKCASAELGQVADQWPLGTWNTVRLTIDTNGFRACINGQIVASQADALLSHWVNPDSYTLHVGDFQGQVDHLVVRSMTTNSMPVPPSNHAPVATGGLWTMDTEFLLPVTLDATDADGDALTYTITRAPAHGAIAGEGAVRAYAPGADFDGEDSFAFKVSDGYVESSEAEVVLRRNTAQTVCLYRFNGDGNDRMGQESSLTLSGAAVVSDGRLRVSAAGDRVTVSIPRRHVYIGTNTQYLCVEARVWVEAFKGLGQAGATDLFGLDGNWSVVMKILQLPWESMPAAKMVPGGDVLSPVLGAVLTTGQWHDLRLSMDTNGYNVVVDGWSTTVAAPNSLSAWANPSDLLLHCGGFDGWIDFIEVRHQ